MSLLQYDISVVGLQNVERAMATIEARFAAHNRRVVGAVNRTANAPAIRAARSVSAKQASPEKEAQTAARAGAALDRQRSTALMAQHRQRERLRAKEHRDALRDIERESKAAARASERARASFRSKVGTGAGIAGRSLAGIGKAGLAVTGLGGGALVATKLGGAASLEQSQRALSVAGRTAGGASPLSYDQIRSKVENTSISSGQSQEEITAGMREYVSATGDLKGAAEQINFFATTATAAEASVSDVSKAAAYLSTALGISAKEMPDALAKLYFQGKKGAFELKDIASAVPALGSQAATLGMHGMEGMTTLGGLAQIAQKGTGNTAEAQTALSNLFNQIVAKSGKLQSGEAFSGHKVGVFENNDPTKDMLNIRTVLADIVAGSRGNIQQLNDFAEIRGSKALNPFVNAYKGAHASTNGTEAEKVEAGRRAVLKMIEDSSDAAGTFKDVQSDAADIQKSANIQLEMFNTMLTAAVQKDLLPAIVRLGPQIIKLVPFFEKLVNVVADLATAFAKNPLENVGHIIATKIALDIASAAIGPAIKDALVRAVSGGGGAPGAPGGGGGMGVVGTALSGLVIATLAVETFKAGTLIIDSMVTNNKKDVEGDLARFGNKPKTLEEAKAQAEKVQARISGLDPSAMDSAFRALGPAILDEVLGSGKGIGGVRESLGVSENDVQAGFDLKAQQDERTRAALIAELKVLQDIIKNAGPNRGTTPSPVKS